ncbi:MAG: uroporphyrinogen-III synthase [Acidimicrobiales bacterium]
MIQVLDGFTVGITADRRSDEQASLFERRGATVVFGQAIRTLPLGEDEGLRTATEAVIRSKPQVLVANTGLGIRSWFGAAESWDLGEDLLDALRSTRIYARGPKAAGAVHALGLDVLSRASSERLSEVVDLVLADLGPGDTVVVQRDGGPSSPQTVRLGGIGNQVIEVPVYRWQANDDPTPARRLAEGIVAGRVHGITFTSAPAITTWMELVSGGGLMDPVLDTLAAGDVVVGCVGPACAEVAVSTRVGAGGVVVPGTSRLGPLVRAVSRHLVERSRRVGDLEISGTVVRCGDRRIELSDIEARLLGALSRRPGTVITKTDLLRDVWGDASADPHLVEVAVGRLRRRLGPQASAIAVVPRRGYVLR